jgi:L-asparaginase II
MDDGNNARACEVALAAVLAAVLRLDDADAAVLATLTDAPLVNWNGIEVGRLRTAWRAMDVGGA